MTNEEVCNRIQNAIGVQDDLLTMIKKRKLRWYGHISRSLAQTTAALSRLKIIWRDQEHLLVSKVKLMRTLILSTFLYACESLTFTAETERRIQALEMRYYRRLLNISYKAHVTNEEVRNRIQNAIGVQDIS